MFVNFITYLFTFSILWIVKYSPVNVFFNDVCGILRHYYARRKVGFVCILICKRNNKVAYFAVCLIKLP